MPAISYKLYLCPAANDAPSEVMSLPRWCNAGELFTQYRPREVLDQGFSYDDYAILLTAGEALVWNKRCWEQFIQQMPEQEAGLRAEMKQFEAALVAAKWVVLERYEWESGLS